MQAGLAGDPAAGIEQGLNHRGVLAGRGRRGQGAAGSASRVAGDVDGVFDHDRQAVAAKRQFFDDDRHVHPQLVVFVVTPAPRAQGSGVELSSGRVDLKS
ncbi:hypothetical protein D3C78_1534230 [compost metagenome]